MTLQCFITIHLIAVEIFQSESKEIFILLFNMRCTSSRVFFNSDIEAEQNMAKILPRYQPKRGRREHRVNWLMILFPRIFREGPLKPGSLSLLCTRLKTAPSRAEKFQSKGCQFLFTVKWSASTLGPPISNQNVRLNVSVAARGGT